MSRFVEILNEHEREISVESFNEMLTQMTTAARFRGRPSRDDFPVLRHEEGAGDRRRRACSTTRRPWRRSSSNGAAETWLKVVVPVTSLCPCSKQISDYGAHNQRSHLTISARIARARLDRGADRGRGVSEASCELYGILKRPDEKFVTERAYDNPKFVEDIVRDVATRLNADDRIRCLRRRSRELRVDPQPLGLRAHRARQGRSGGLRVEPTRLD